MYFIIQANYSESSGLYRNDEGTCLGKVECDISNIEPELWKIQEEGDNSPTYLDQREYKNSYYRISGKITAEEMRNIINDIMF